MRTLSEFPRNIIKINCDIWGPDVHTFVYFYFVVQKLTGYDTNVNYSLTEIYLFILYTYGPITIIHASIQ